MRNTCPLPLLLAYLLFLVATRAPGRAIGSLPDGIHVSRPNALMLQLLAGAILDRIGIVMVLEMHNAADLAHVHFSFPHSYSYG